jgi:hypothetical protein
MLQKLQFFFEKEHLLIEINSAPPTKRFFRLGGRIMAASIQEPRKKLKS